MRPSCATGDIRRQGSEVNQQRGAPQVASPLRRQRVLFTHRTFTTRAQLHKGQRREREKCVKSVHDRPSNCQSVALYCLTEAVSMTGGTAQVTAKVRVDAAPQPVFSLYLAYLGCRRMRLASIIASTGSNETAALTGWSRWAIQKRKAQALLHHCSDRTMAGKAPRAVKRVLHSVQTAH